MFISYRQNYKQSFFLIKSQEDLNYLRQIREHFILKADAKAVFFSNKKRKENYYKKTLANLKLNKKYKQYNKKQLEELAKEITEKNFKAWDGKTYLISKFTVPSSLVYKVKKYCDKKNIPLNIKYMLGKEKLKVSRKEYNNLRKIQKEIIKEIYLDYKENNFVRLIVDIPIGKGKSYIIENFSKLFPKTTAIIVVPTVSLYEQYLKKEDVNDISKNGIIKNKVNICKVHYFNTYFEAIKTNKIDFLLLDEIHYTEIANIGNRNLSFIKKGIIGFTATFPKKNHPTFKTILTTIASRKFKIKFQEAYNTVPKVKIVKYNKYITGEFQEVKEQFITDKNKIQNIIKIIKKHNNIFITFQYKEHLKQVAIELDKSGIKYAKITGATSNNKREEILNLIKEGKIKVLLGTTALKVGINMEYIEAIIFLAGYKSYTPVIQFIGRIIRGEDKKISKKIIYDFEDKGIAYYQKYSKERLKIYKENGWKIQKIELS